MTSHVLLMSQRTFCGVGASALCLWSSVSPQNAFIEVRGGMNMRDDEASVYSSMGVKATQSGAATPSTSEHGLPFSVSSDALMSALHVDVSNFPFLW
uniref:Putative secreted protein n=1 Tax=Ixodes ricinus TaxID=34613 RepID=A0A6B0UDN1_IXORI